MRFRLFNPRGDLFATVFCFGTHAALRVASSLILTRILKPDAYGVMVILMSILFVVELLADLGLTLFIVRDAHGEDPAYINTAWTIRLSRAVLNCAIIFLGAPLIASLYEAPSLELPLRVFSLWFLLAGLESMSFPLATRRRMSRITMYSELSASVISTIFSIIYCTLSGDYWGMIFGTLLNRALLTALSYRFFPEARPSLRIEKEPARQIMRFSRFTMPSSVLTLALTQFDKVIFLRLFDLRLLGIYGLAGSFAAQVEGLISTISQKVLYPRSAQAFRDNPSAAHLRYYADNRRLFASMLTLPAVVGGAAGSIISVLYPGRYQGAAFVLQALMIRAALLSLAAASEDLLISAGQSQVILVGNVYRAIGVLAGCLGGYYLFGFTGFVIGLALGGLPPLLYYLTLQHRLGLLIVRFELYKVGFLLSVAAISYAISYYFLLYFPYVHLTLGHREA